MKKQPNLIINWVREKGEKLPSKFEIKSYNQYLESCEQNHPKQSPENPPQMADFVSYMLDFEKIASMDPNTELMSYIRIMAEGYKTVIGTK